jgi:amino acid transporter
MGINSGAGRVFGWFANMTAVAGLMTWFGICITYIRFYAGTLHFILFVFYKLTLNQGLKAQGMDRSKMPFASSLQPYAAWYAMILSFIICFVRSFFFKVRMVI